MVTKTSGRKKHVFNRLFFCCGNVSVRDSFYVGGEYFRGLLVSQESRGVTGSYPGLS